MSGKRKPLKIPVIKMTMKLKDFMEYLVIYEMLLGKH
ncbi:hypothetical protein X975_14577, partial [Stegodyphus mimosarum]